jgi:hypothetical protein
MGRVRSTPAFGAVASLFLHFLLAYVPAGAGGDQRRGSEGLQRRSLLANASSVPVFLANSCFIAPPGNSTTSGNQACSYAICFDGTGRTGNVTQCVPLLRIVLVLAGGGLHAGWGELPTLNVLLARAWRRCSRALQRDSRTF